MAQDDLMTLLKLDLSITSAAYDPLLRHDLQTAQELIKEEGITLTDSVRDSNLIIMYASYLYRKRATQEGMPRMLRYALNNRLFAEKAGGGSV